MDVIGYTLGPKVNNTLAFIKTRNTPSGHVEVHLASVGGVAVAVGVRGHAGSHATRSVVACRGGVQEDARSSAHPTIHHGGSEVAFATVHRVVVAWYTSRAGPGWLTDSVTR